MQTKGVFPSFTFKLKNENSIVQRIEYYFQIINQGYIHFLYNQCQDNNKISIIS